MHEEVRPRGVQLAGDRRTDAARAAGDQDDVTPQGVGFGRVIVREGKHARERYRNHRAA